MISVSDEFLQEMEKRQDFKEYATVTLSNGQNLQLTPADFTISNQKFIDGSGSNKFPIGHAVERSVQIELMNDRDQFSYFDFYGAIFVISIKLPGIDDEIKKGKFIATDPQKLGSVISIMAVDRMYNADQSLNSYTSWSEYSTIYNVLWKSAQMLDIPLDQSVTTSRFPMLSKTVKCEKPDGTFRDLIGYCAMFCGGNAIINGEGNIDIIPYDFSYFLDHQILDGGVFDGASGKYSSGDDADGGTFHPWSSGFENDGGTFGDRAKIHVLPYFKNIEVDTDDIVIEGVLLSDGSENEELYQPSNDKYYVTLYNPLFEGMKTDMQDFFENLLIGVRFRKFSGDYLSNPTIESFDNVYIIDGMSRVYQSTVTDVDFNVGGWTSIANNSENVSRNRKRLQYIKNLISAGGIIAKPGDLEWPF